MKTKMMYEMFWVINFRTNKNVNIITNASIKKKK